MSDPDDARRNAVASRARAHLAPIQGLAMGRLDSGRTTVLWYAGPGAPIGSAAGESASAVVWGDALLGGDGGRADPAQVAREWLPERPSPATFDGFHAAVAIAGDEIAVGADILGLFPVYHALVGDVLLVASSPEPMRLHPLFREQVSAAGLFGILMASGPVEGRTLLEGVRRLRAGALLRWRPGTEVREVEHYVFPEAERHGAMRFEDQVALLDDAVDAAVARHAKPHGPMSMLLSGGRDSRVIGGYLRKHHLLRDTVTFGKHTDNDAACADDVAHTLGVPHRTREIPFAAFPSFADASVRWEHLSGGMSTVHTWGTAAEVKPSSGALASGYMFEIRTIPALPPTRDAMLETTYARAITPDALRALVRAPALRDLVSDVEASIRRAYDATTHDEAERSWRWRTSMFARFHPGSVPWRLSLSAWPVIPILDRALLRTMIELPRASMFDRKLQDALLARRLPELARLPLDRNAHDVRPLAPSFVWRAREAVSEYVQRLTPASGVQAIRAAKPTDERRYYVRIYDFDNPGWQRVRAAAEPGRSALAEWFDLRSLASIVPAPDQRASHADPIAQGFAPKTIVGLMRWMSLRANGS